MTDGLPSIRSEEMRSYLYNQMLKMNEHCTNLAKVLEIVEAKEFTTLTPEDWAWVKNGTDALRHFVEMGRAMAMQSPTVLENHEVMGHVEQIARDELRRERDGG